MTDREPVGLRASTDDGQPPPPRADAARPTLAHRVSKKYRRVLAESLRSRIPQMAAALSYRTIFALIPVIAVAMVVVRSFVSRDDLKWVLAKGFEYAGLTDIVLEKQAVLSGFVGPMPDGSPPAGTPESGLTGSLRLDEWIANLVSRTSELPFTAVGIIAVITLIYAAIGMLVEVERAFNAVYRASSARSWPRRVTLYWTLLTLGAIGLFASIYLGEQFRAWAVRATEGGFSLIGVGTPVKAIGFAVTVTVSTLLLLLAYTTVPTARVRLWPALGGAFLGAVLWEASKWGFTQYLHYSATYARLYGALALIPLFLLWVYLTWIVVLIGLQFAYVLQYGLASDEPRGAARVIDPTSGIPIIAAIACAFSRGRTTQAQAVARSAGIGLEAAEAILGRFQERGLVHVVRHAKGGPEGYTLARPPEAIQVSEVLAAAYEAAHAPTDAEADAAAGVELATRLRKAQFECAGRTTVAGLVREGKPKPQPEERAYDSRTRAPAERTGATLPPGPPGAQSHDRTATTSDRADNGAEGPRDARERAAGGGGLRAGGVLPEGGPGQGAGG
jgi:YihY family inner membrane protein